MNMKLSIQGIKKLRARIFPILRGYYANGETYKGALRYAKKDWQEITDLIKKLEI